MAKGKGNWSPESYIFKIRCKRPRSEIEIARLEGELYILRRKKYELIKK